MMVDKEGALFRPLNVNITHNVSSERMLENIKRNAGLPEIKREEPHGRTLAILGTAPSVVAWIECIKALDADVMAVNDAHDWAVRCGIKIKYAAAMDGTPGAFDDCMKASKEGVEYLLASMTDPELVERLDNVTLWHSWQGRGEERILGPNKMLVGGGSSIGLRAINLGYVLGYRKFHLYGIEGSKINGEDYAHDSAHSCGEAIKVYCAGKWFECAPVHAGQAQDFTTLTTKTMTDIDLIAHGEGLIPHINRILRSE